MINDITNKDFWKATGIRCLRSFLSVIAGAQSISPIITEIDWRVTLLSALSTTFWIFIACVMAGLPEVKFQNDLIQLSELNEEPDVDEEVED